MTREEIMSLDLEQIEARTSDIVRELKDADAESIEALSAEIDAIEERRAEIRAEIEQRKLDIAEIVKGHGDIVETVIERKGEKMEIRNTKEYIDAFAEYIKTENDAECRALTSTNDTTPNGTGTVAVPDFVYDIVKNAWERDGIMSLVRKTYLKGNLKVQFEISASDAAVHAEGASAVSEETLVLGIVNLSPVSLKKWVSVSDEIMDLRGEAFLRYIYDEIAYKIAKKAADTLIEKIEACGTVSTTTCPGVPTVTAASPALGTVAAAMGKLSAVAANPVVMMNRATWSTFKAVQYAASYAVDPFEGLPIVFTDKITAFGAATTGVTYAIVGDLGEGAIANFPNGEGIEFKFDEHTEMTKDLVRVLGREYVALGVVAPNAFVKIVK